MELPLTCPQKDDRPGDVTWIVGGGAYKASDKIIQHNGCGRVNVRSHSPQMDYSLLT